MSSLSIIIPSYNRHEKARDTLRALIAQLTDNCTLLVIDNNSQTDYHSFLSQSDPAIASGINTGQIQIIRNQSNVGMSANFLRAFESCNSEWMWLISDDDVIHEDAIANILEETQQLSDKPEVAFIKFSSKGCEEEKRTLRYLEELIDILARSKHYFNSYIFLSNGLYRFPHFKSQIQIGYQNLHTYVPHLMMLLNYLNANSGKETVLLTDKRLASYVIPEMGYSYSMVAGLGVGAFKNFRYNLTTTQYLKLEGIFAPHNDFKVALDLFYDAKANSNMFVARRLADNYYVQIRRARNPLQRLTYKSLTLLFYTPKILDGLIRLLQRVSPGMDRHISEIKLRTCAV